MSEAAPKKPKRKPAERIRKRVPFFLAFGSIVLFLLVFGGPSAFRDGPHFYGPLFRFLFEELQAGRFPLWNPYENIGQPLAANPTSMLFYPATYVAFLPVFAGLIDTDTALVFFSAGHLLLAFWTVYRLARTGACSRDAASLAAVAYVLGGSVLIQWHNVPFLVGAAWFPEAIRQTDRLIRRGRLRYSVGLGVLLSLMILGGDPQAAYHALFCAVVLLLCSNRSTWLRGIGLLGLSGIVTLLLAGIQILPAWELNGFSDRSHSAYQSIVYRFSLPPWRLLEFLWPGVGGWQFPVHARWFNAMPGENGIWTPSLYMGLLPFLLALFSIVSVRKRTFASSELPSSELPRTACRVLLLVFLLGGLGNWFFVYPILEFLPLYETFRYPGKLTVVASLFLSVFAAEGFDQVFKTHEAPGRSAGRPAIAFRILAVLGTLAACGMIFFGERHWFSAIPSCPLFGPFDETTARNGLLRSLYSVLGLWIFFEISIRSRCRRTLILSLVIADLILANAWLLPVSSTIFSKNQRNGGRQQASPLPADMDAGVATPLRIYRFPLWYPPEFKEKSSATRLDEIVRWEHDSLYPRYPLPMRIDMVEVRGTLMLKDYRAETDVIRREIRLEQFDEAIGRLERLGVRYVVAPENAILDAEKIEATPNGPADVSFWKLRNPSNRDYIRYEPNRIVFDVSPDRPEIVVLTEQYYPGWKAFDGDGEIPIRKVGPAFRGVELSAGKHRIEMVYDPPLVKIGAALSLLGLLLSSILFVLPSEKIRDRES